jgi:FtsH-binding integral membrane protein
MALSPDYRTYTGATRAAETAAVLDAGLRAYMLRVYNWMASGLVLTGIVAYVISSTPLLSAFYPLVMTASGRMVPAPTLLGWIAIFSPVAFVLVLNVGVNKFSITTVQALYWAFCLAMGASMAMLLEMYTSESVARVFFITAGTFAAMSIFGYTTNRDLTKFGSFLIMGMFGLFLAMLVNMFLGSSGMQFVISIVGVLVFTGLAAYDTQRIKASFVQFAYAYGPGEAAKRSVYDALGLYLNFVNLFQFLLMLMGNRNSN